MTKLNASEKIQKYEKQYERLKSHLRKVGFICEGSLVERWMLCGKPSCRCARDYAMKHGPYYQLSWKENGKTVSRRLSSKHAALYRQWIANRRVLESVLLKMHAVSKRTHPYLLAPIKPPKKHS